ncbi:hypothetical protein [Nocardia sp. NPDC057272]|uniref:hypothetical protein n=1 Tax=Nocardia sp. NPDC057272 TaxID=3346079 RepID=UPI00363D4BEE
MTTRALVIGCGGTIGARESSPPELVTPLASFGASDAPAVSPATALSAAWSVPVWLPPVTAHDTVAAASETVIA